MERQTQIEIGRRLLDAVRDGKPDMMDQTFQVDVAHYTSIDQAADEREILFRDFPVMVAASCELPGPGDFVTSEATGVPSLVVRNKNGAARAFINVCRHRGSRVETAPSGSKKQAFTCSYHGWTYDTDGNLKVIPQEFGFEGFDKSCNGLRELPVVEKHGFIWVRHTPGEGFDLSDYTSGIEQDLDAYGLDTWHHFKTTEIRCRMNWKLVMDTFFEGYHIGKLHKATIAHIFNDMATAFDAFGRNHRLVLGRRKIEELRNLPESEWDVLPCTAVTYCLFPNTIIVYQADHVEIFRVFPGERPDESFAILSFLTPEAATTEKAKNYWQKNLDLLIETVKGEDFPAGETIQAGIPSGAQEHFTWGRYELALAHYHKGIKEVLGRPQLLPKKAAE
ncbi:MAG: Rieske 2Fe-2S domain-containing protein [Rhodospirillales bacterium]|nr:Rieske 2Fe-2S domain-containing protein [Rhodospirillales bacterium]